MITIFLSDKQCRKYRMGLTDVEIATSILRTKDTNGEFTFKKRRKGDTIKTIRGFIENRLLDGEVIVYKL